MLRPADQADTGGLGCIHTKLRNLRLDMSLYFLGHYGILGVVIWHASEGFPCYIVVLQANLGARRGIFQSRLQRLNRRFESA